MAVAEYGPARPTFQGQVWTAVKPPSLSCDPPLARPSRWACRVVGTGGPSWPPFLPVSSPETAQVPRHLSPDLKDASAPNPSQGHEMTPEPRIPARTHGRWDRRQRARPPRCSTRNHSFGSSCISLLVSHGKLEREEIANVEQHIILIIVVN